MLQGRVLTGLEHLGESGWSVEQQPYGVPQGPRDSPAAVADRHTPNLKCIWMQGEEDCSMSDLRPPPGYCQRKLLGQVYYSASVNTCVTPGQRNKRTTRLRPGCGCRVSWPSQSSDY